MRTRWLIATFMVLGGCSPGPFTCPNDPATPVPDPATVCAHIASIDCFIDPDPDAADAGIAPSCEIGYGEVQAAVPTEELHRLLRCYMAARVCEDLEGCNQSCGPDGGHITYRPGQDAGALDAGVGDAGVEDAAVDDAGVDAAVADAGTDAAVPDAGTDAGAEDDAGPPDAG